jgi:hypothetical protein
VHLCDDVLAHFPDDDSCEFVAYADDIGVKVYGESFDRIDRIIVRLISTGQAVAQKKTVVYSTGNATAEQLAAARQWAGANECLHTTDGVKYLGSPIGTPEFVQAAVESEFDKIQSALVVLARHPAFHLQSALALLSVCIAPRCMYLFRTCSLSPHMLEDYDRRIDASLTRLLKGTVSAVPADQRAEAMERMIRTIRLPLRSGGWGLRNAQLVGRSAFSAAAITSMKAFPFVTASLSEQDMDTDYWQQLCASLEWLSARAPLLRDNNGDATFGDDHLTTAVPAAPERLQDPASRLAYFQRIRTEVSRPHSPVKTDKLQNRTTRLVERRLAPNNILIQLGHSAAAIHLLQDTVSGQAVLKQATDVKRVPLPLSTGVFQTYLRMLFDLPLGLNFDNPSDELNSVAPDLTMQEAVSNTRILNEGVFQRRHDRVRDILMEECAAKGIIVEKEVGFASGGMKRLDLFIDMDGISFAVDVRICHVASPGRQATGQTTKALIGAQETAKLNHYRVELSRDYPSTEMVPFICTTTGGLNHAAFDLCMAIASFGQGVYQEGPLERLQIRREFETLVHRLQAAIIVGNARIINNAYHAAVCRV